MTLDELNRLPRYRAEEEFLKCCGSRAWARAMSQRRPFSSLERLVQAAGEIWFSLDAADWTEAFCAHPRIGERKVTGAPAAEQSGMIRAPAAVTSAIEEANQEYFEKFGFIFIICAAGKTGEQMLDNLRSRLPNTPDQELRIAADEQNQITVLRLNKAFPL